MVHTDFEAGETVWARGLDMKCFPILCKLRIVEVLKEPTEHGWDCVTESKGGIRILSRLKDLYKFKEDVPLN